MAGRIAHNGVLRRNTAVEYEVQNFQTDVIERSRHIPVLVDFWAPWCEPCLMLKPVLEQLAQDWSDRCALVQVNTELQPHLAMQYGVRSIPTLLLFVHGEVVDQLNGALPRHQLERWLERTLPSRHLDDLVRAEALLAAGRAGECTGILQRVLAAEPDNARALVLMARSLLETDPARAADHARRVKITDDGYDTAQALVQIARLFELWEHPEALPESASRQPYLAAIGALREGRAEDALEGFLRVVRSDRGYDDDGARKACVAIFHYLGDDHPATRRYRSELSSALYA